MTRFARLRRDTDLDMLVNIVCGGMAIEDAATLDGPAASRRRAGRPAKLGAADRAEIAASAEPIRALMEKFAVSRSTITRARRVKTSAPTSEL